MLSQQQSPRKDPDSEREVFRGPGSAILSWAWFVVALIILVDLAVQGRDHVAAVTAAVVLAITGIVYACAWRPKIVADSAGITVMNPVRDHRILWTAVDKVDVVNAVRVHYSPVPGAARGKILYSWAVQSSPRSARRAALRREISSQPRARLTLFPRSPQPPRGAAPRDGQVPRYGEAPRYGEMPDAAREALDRSSAEFTAGRLAERAQHARQAAALAAGQRRPADQDAGQAGDPAGAAAGSTLMNGNIPAAGLPTAQWAWLPIAAMTVPLLLVLVVVLV